MSNVKEYIGRKSIEAVDYDGNGNDLCNMWLTEEEVIRCQDCRYCGKERFECNMHFEGVDYFDALIRRRVQPNYFCAWAERDE